MRVRPSRIEFNRVMQRRLRLGVIFSLKIDLAYVYIDDAKIAFGSSGAIQVRKRCIWVIVFPLDIPHIRQGLSILGIERQLGFEFLFGCLVLLCLPVKIAQAEMNVGFARGNLHGGFKFRNGLFGPSFAIEGLAGKDVRLSGIRILLQDPAKLLLRVPQNKRVRLC